MYRKQKTYWDVLSLSGDVNLALLQPATQSTTLADRVASAAVDGTAGYDSFSSTAPNDYKSWWKVQLTEPVWVTRIEFINTRYDGV